MDSILQSMNTGQEGMAADQQNSRPKVSPRRKYPKGFLSKGAAIKPFAQMSPGQSQMHSVQKNKIDQNIKMGAQGFPETDWAPTENEADRAELESHMQYQKMDMDLFQDLQSELGVMSEIGPFNRRKSQVPGQRSSDIRKEPSPKPPTRNAEPYPMRAAHHFNKTKEIRDDITNGITIESLLDPNHVEDDTSSYKLTLRIKFQTSMGESLAVVGDIKELGCWNQFADMQWTEGHVWVLKNLAISSKSYFSYKYVLMKDGKPEVWEQGENRLADLRKLGDQDAPLIDEFDFFGGKQHTKIDNPQKQVEILDKWENFEIKFSIHTEVAHTQDYIMISGPCSELGGDQNPLKLTRAHYKRPKGWLDGKYGKDVRPFEISIPFTNGLNTLETFPATIKYRYIKMSRNQQVRERLKQRELKIEKPENYRGINKTDGTVWIINGVVDQVEGNFLGDRFRFHKVNDYNLYFGSYLATDQDLNKIQSAGIKHVINLQTDDEIQNLQINLKELSDQYTNHNIRLVRTPLKDIQEEEYAYELQRVAEQIHAIVDKQKQSVLVHCSSGQSRSPTVVMAYLCLHKQLQYQNNIGGCLSLMKNISQDVCPNVRAVEIAIEKQDGEVRKRISSDGSGDPIHSAQKAQSPVRKQDQVDDRMSAMTSIEKMLEDDKLMKPHKTAGINLNLAGIQGQNLLQYETSSAREDQSSAFNYRPMKSNRKQKKEQQRVPDFDVGSQITSAPWDKEVDSDASRLDDSFAKPQNTKQVKLQTVTQSKQSIFEYQESVKQQKMRDQELQAKQQKIREYEEQKAKAHAAEMAEKERLKQIEILEKQNQEKLREEAKKIQQEIERVQKQAQLDQQEHEQRQKELLEKQKQDQREFEEQLRREMEKKLKIQQYEAEKALQQKEELMRMEQEKQLLEEEERRIRKERKQKKLDEEAAKKKREEEQEKQRIQEEMDRKMQELADLQDKLEQEQKERLKMEEEKAKRHLEMQAALEAEKLKAQKEREEAQRIVQEKQQKESEEIERLKKIQEALISASKHKRQMKEEKKKKRAETLAQIQMEREIEEQESKRLAEEMKRKMEEAKKDQKPTPIIVQQAPVEVQKQEVTTPENAEPIKDKYLMASLVSGSELASEIPMAARSPMQPHKQEVWAHMQFTESEMATPATVIKPRVDQPNVDETVTMSPSRRSLGYNTQEQINEMTKKAEEKRQARYQQVAQVAQSPKKDDVVEVVQQQRTHSKPPKPQPVVTKSTPPPQSVAKIPVAVSPIVPNSQQVESPALNPDNVIDETLDQTIIMGGSQAGKIGKESKQQAAALHKQIDQYIIETESYKRLEDQKALILQKTKETEAALQKLDELKEKEQQLIHEQKAQELAASQRLTETQKQAERLELKQKETQESLTKEQLQRKIAEESRLQQLQEKEEEIEKLKLQLEREKRQKTEIEKRKQYEDELRMRKEVETQLQLEQEKRMRETIATTLKAQLEQEKLKREQETLWRQQRDTEDQELQKENAKLQEEREIRIKQERERIDVNLKAAREAEESAKRLKMEIESLEKQRKDDYQQEVSEMAQAGVAGSMIINLVEKEIANILREEQEKAKREELERDERLRQIQMEKDKIAEIQQRQLEAEQAYSVMSSKASAKPEELKQISIQSPQDKKNLDQLGKSFQISDYMDEEKSQDETINDLLDQNIESPPPKILPQPVEHKRRNSATLFNNYEEPQEEMGIQVKVAQTPMREKIAPKVFKVAAPVKKPVQAKKVQPKKMDQLVFNSMDEQEQYFEHLFDEAPLPFKPRKNNANDEQVNSILSDYGYTIPVVHIKDKLYLVGNNRVTCDFKFNQVLVKGGGGSQKLEDYIAKNEETMQNNIIEGMAKSGRDVGYVVEQFKEGKKIHKTIASMSSVVSMSQISQMSMATTVRAPPSKRNESPRKAPVQMNATTNSGIRVYEGSIRSMSPTRQPKSSVMTKDKIGRVPSNRNTPQKF